MQANLPESRQRVYDVISANSTLGGVSTVEISNILKLPINSISGRVTELNDKGLIRDSGRRCVNPSGKPAILWVVSRETKAFEFDESGQGVLL